MSKLNSAHLINTNVNILQRVLTEAKKTAELISIFVKQSKNNHKFIYYLITLLPHMLLTLCATYIKYSSKWSGDEVRYLDHSRKYFFNASGEEMLWNGPFYPIVIKSLHLWGESKLLVVSFNFFFLMGAIIIAYQTIKYFVNKVSAYWLTLLFATYCVFCAEFSRALTEALAVLLFTSMVCLSLSLIEKYTKEKFVLLVICMTFLVLTKVIFGYIFLAYPIAFLVLYLKERDPNLIKLSIAPLFAILLCTPYLIHTYNISGKIYYWGTAGGLQLYWMTTLSPYEYGDWNNLKLSIECFDGSMFCNREFWAKAHQDVVDKASQLSPVAMDEYLKSVALENIKTNPVKYVKNIITNAGRLVFGYPYSYTFQTIGGLFRIILNSFFVFPFAAAIILYLLNRLPKIESAILLLVFGYLGATLLVAAYPRFFYPVIPSLIIFMVISMSRSVSIRIH